MATFKLRPHHLLCILCFRGKGYNEEFIRNLKLIHKKLNSKSSHTTIKIVNGCDDICTKCPERQKGFCKNEGKVAKIDDAYLKILQLEIDQILTFEDLKARTKRLLTMEKFQLACKKCSWYSSNICSPIVQEIIKS